MRFSLRSRESVSASSNKAKDNKITVAAAEESEEKTETKQVNLKASQISHIDGVKNPYKRYKISKLGLFPLCGLFFSDKPLVHCPLKFKSEAVR